LEFKQAVVTQQGRQLMAKLLAGKSTKFTKIAVSSTVYQDGQLEGLTVLTNIKQEASAQAYGNNTATVSVVGAIENTGLTVGYYINTVGLYASDPDKGEILYSVSSAAVNGYMPPDTGVSKSGITLKIYTEVGNATQVNLTVDPAGVATLGDVTRIESAQEVERKKLNLATHGAHYIEPPVNGYEKGEIWYYEVGQEWDGMNLLNVKSGKMNVDMQSKYYYEYRPKPQLILNPGERVTWLLDYQINNTTVPQALYANLAYMKSNLEATQDVTSSIIRLDASSGTGNVRNKFTMPNFSLDDATSSIMIRFARHSSPHTSNVDFTKLMITKGDYDGEFARHPEDVLDASFGYFVAKQSSGTFNFNHFEKYTGQIHSNLKTSRVDMKEVSAKLWAGEEVELTFTADFSGKVSGGTTENPHVALHGATVDLPLPTVSYSESQTSYENMQLLDGKLAQYYYNGDKFIARQLFKWNLVEDIERRVPGIFSLLGASTLSEKTVIARKMVKLLNPKIWGYGKGPSGNRLDFKAWTGSAWSTSSPTNSTESINSMGHHWTLPEVIAWAIQNDGMVYMLAHAEASDGTTPSTVNVDYASLTYTIKLKMSDFYVPRAEYNKQISEIQTWIQNHT